MSREAEEEMMVIIAQVKNNRKKGRDRFWKHYLAKKLDVVSEKVDVRGEEQERL